MVTPIFMEQDRQTEIPNLGNVETWVFDLDNTLYRVPPPMYAELDRRMRGFVSDFLGIDSDAAYAIQKDYFRKYGLTLRGLMVNHGLDPKVYESHMGGELDYSALRPDPRLLDAIAALEGRKVIYTNAFASHARLVLDLLALDPHFDAVYDIEAAGYRPKPAIESYRHLCALHGIDAGRAAMIDDIPHNLEPAARMGMATVWVRTGAAWDVDDAAGPHIHHRTDDIAGWLQRFAAPC